TDTSGEGLPLYTSERTKKYIHERFPYLFIDHEKGGGIPKLDIISIDERNSENPLKIRDIEIVPIPMMHGNHHTMGFIFAYTETSQEKKSIAYLTDCNYISDESISEIKKAGGQIEHLVIDALREREHSSHCNFLQAMTYAEQIKAKHSWFTHMTHDKKHTQIQAYINENLHKFPGLQKIIANGGSVSPSYDGLILQA
ncbi:MAG: hypothetical protein IJ727_11330, partial [Treponema sp.]|nr:hypothetical protein [Treponema sp.]